MVVGFPWSPVGEGYHVLVGPHEHTRYGQIVQPGPHVTAGCRAKQVMFTLSSLYLYPGNIPNVVFVLLLGTCFYSWLNPYPCTGSFPASSAPSLTEWKQARRPDSCKHAERCATSFCLQKVCSRTRQTRTSQVPSISALGEEWRWKKIENYVWKPAEMYKVRTFTGMRINLNSPPSANV